ncbi:hypothetical protein [Actinoplanes solisilvae]|uniref:hypothetical protein n=1 Tax=Actinoplanes solisilvae TaxID=2486853 RepID=UPI000FDB0840|nr:hypothetical protein [Actinoplanes solisilvae]
MPGTTLVRLVDEFVATLHQHGLVIDRPPVEQEMRDRITAIAERLRVDPEVVLRDHACPGWGREMASDVICQIQNESLRMTPPTARHASEQCDLAG